MVDEVGVVRGRDAPLLLPVRLEDVCSKTCRTVSCETASTTSKVTRRSASRRRLQCFRPGGGALHASAIRRASCSPPSVRVYSRSDVLRVRAASSPAVAYAWRTRATVDSPTSSAPAIAASVQAGPASPRLAFSRMRACVSVRAGALPLPISVCSRARSPSLNSTTYCFAIVPLPRCPVARPTVTARIRPGRLLFKWRLTRH